MRKKSILYHLSEAFKLSLQRVVALCLALFGILVFAQINKLDPRFQILLNNKDKVAKGEKVPELELHSKQLDKHIVVTGKGAKVMYSSIIYTKDIKRLKDLGVLVQSEVGTFVTALITTEDIENLLAEPSVISIVAPMFDELHNDVSTAQSGASLLHTGVLNNTKFTGKNVLVGMNSVILDEADIGENTIIGANSTVKAKAQIPENSLVLGSPAKVIRALDEKEIAWKSYGTNEYIRLAQRCLSTMQEVEPFTEDHAQRLTYTVFQSAHDIKQNLK